MGDSEIRRILRRPTPTLRVVQDVKGALVRLGKQAAQIVASLPQTTPAKGGGK